MRKVSKELLRNYVKEQNFKSSNDVLTAMKEMFADVLQEALKAEMDAHLGYDRYEISEKSTDNSRNGYSKKTVKSELGNVELNMPRDIKGEFESQIIPRHKRSIIGLDEKILSLYARDTSSKIKAVRKSACKAGKYIGCYAPYGYIKDPQDKHHLIIDEPAAAVVRKIFDLRCKGFGCRKIAQILNEENILPPRVYHYQTIGKINPHRDNRVWNDVTVRKLMRNEVYIGNMVQNKKGTLSYKNHKIIDKPKEEWVKVENTHEAIISLDIWELAQEIDKMRSHPRYNSLNIISLFGGLLYCMDCGFALRHQTERHKRKSGKTAIYESYICGNYSRSGHTVCSTHTIYLKPLTELVLADIRAKADIVKFNEADMIKSMSEHIQNQNAQETAVIKKNIKTLNKRLSELEKLLQSVYEDKIKGKIPEAVCIELMNKYQTERTEKSAQLKELEQKIEDNQAVQNDVQEWVKLIRQYSNIETLDRETLLRLIDKIEIGEQKIVNGQKEREIKIHYKFVGYVG